MRGFSIAMAVTLASAAAMVPTGVRACSCTVEPIYHSQPAKGARNVPVDVAPVIEGPFDAATVTLEDEHGVKPSFTLSLGPRVGCIGGWAELVPWQPLAANTRYTIRVEALYKASLPASEQVASLSFTTGSSELPDQALSPPPLTAASVLRGMPDCGGLPTMSTCIGGLETQEPRDTELIARRGDKVLLHISSLIQDDGNYGLEEPPDCVELRRRTLDGRRSEPTKICGAALLARDYRASDAVRNDWVECKDGILGDRAAYDELPVPVDAGAPASPRGEAPGPDEAAAAPDASQSDASLSNAAAPTGSDAGCSAVSAGQSDLSHALPFMLACALVLRGSRRRKPG